MNYTVLIDKYLSDKQHLIEDSDCLNLELFLSGGDGWRFKNIPCPTMEELEILQISVQAKLDQEKINAEALAFLASTDWKCRRHEDQKLMGKTPSLSDKEFMELLIARQEARERIK
jgi:hypothetical protein